MARRVGRPRKRGLKKGTVGARISGAKRTKVGKSLTKAGVSFDVGTTGMTVSVQPKSRLPKYPRHRPNSVTKRQIRQTVKKGQLRIRKKTLEVRRPISQRGRTHPMEAPIPGMPEIPQTLLLDSTAIKRFKYWIDQNRLRIWFVKKGVYDYYDVPESVVIILAQAQSKGNFFYYNIRTTYDFKRIR